MIFSSNAKENSSKFEGFTTEASEVTKKNPNFGLSE
jgi:hypothetical protein